MEYHDRNTSATPIPASVAESGSDTNTDRIQDRWEKWRQRMTSLTVNDKGSFDEVTVIPIFNRSFV